MTIKVMAARRSLGALFSGSDLSGDFGGEIVHSLFDAFTHDIQGKTMHGSSAGLQHLLDRLLVILYKCLVQQRDLFEVFLHTAFNPFGHNFS